VSGGGYCHVCRNYTCTCDDDEYKERIANDISVNCGWCGLPLFAELDGKMHRAHEGGSEECLKHLKAELRAVSEQLAIAQRAMEIRQTWHYSEYNVWLKERFEQIDIVNAAADCDLMTLAFAIAESEAEGESR
jgi:hypothetical protein